MRAQLPHPTVPFHPPTQSASPRASPSPGPSPGPSPSPTASPSPSPSPGPSAIASPGPSLRPPLDPALVLALRDRATRDALGLYVVEGARFAVAAVDARADVVGMIVAPSALRTPMAQMMARRLRQRGVPELRVGADELLALAVAREPQGIVLVLRQRRELIEALTPPPCALWLVVDGVRSPGNLGTALRTAHATGVDGLIVVRDARQQVDPFDPGCVRASMGAIVSTRVIDADVASLRAFADRTSTRLVAAVPRARHDYRAVSYRGATALVLGSEQKGASDAVIDACDLAVRIPMATAMDSLNAAMAAAVLLYEAYGQRCPVARRRG